MLNKPANPHNDKQQQQNDFVISYLSLRQAIGGLGVALPIILITGTYSLSSASSLQSSISHYYYSVMHVVFVAVLCILGGFLLTYRGKSNHENHISNFAGAFAFGVAIFPTNCEGFMGTKYIVAEPWPYWFEYLHYGSAALLFGCFALFCFKIFQASDEGVRREQFDSKKIRRNRFYKICGIGIVISIVMIGAIKFYNSFLNGSFNDTYTTFIFETTSLLFFGASWLLKGSLDWPKSSKRYLRTSIKYFRD